MRCVFDLRGYVFVACSFAFRRTQGTRTYLGPVGDHHTPVARDQAHHRVIPPGDATIIVEFLQMFFEATSGPRLHVVVVDPSWGCLGLRCGSSVAAGEDVPM